MLLGFFFLLFPMNLSPCKVQLCIIHGCVMEANLQKVQSYQWVVRCYFLCVIFLHVTSLNGYLVIIKTVFVHIYGMKWWKALSLTTWWVTCLAKRNCQEENQKSFIRVVFSVCDVKRIICTLHQIMQLAQILAVCLQVVSLFFFLELMTSELFVPLSSVTRQVLDRKGAILNVHNLSTFSVRVCRNAVVEFIG